MNCVGIDVSKGKSMIAVMRLFGEVVVSPFEVRHTASELSELARLLKSLDGETRVVMESTGNYHAPVARLLHDAGLYVSVVNAMLVHDYGNNSLRRAKTDKKDAVKLANYGLDRWLTLPRYVPEEDRRPCLAAGRCPLAAPRSSRARPAGRSRASTGLPARWRPPTASLW